MDSKCFLLLILWLIQLQPITAQQKGRNNQDPYYVEQVQSPFNDTIKTTEIRLIRSSSAFSTTKYLFDKFGKWDEHQKGGQLPILIWRKIKLFPDSEQLYDVATTGLENMQEMYSSFIVRSADQNDLLSENNIMRPKLLLLFAQGIAIPNDSAKCYREVRKLMR